MTINNLRLTVFRLAYHQGLNDAVLANMDMYQWAKTGADVTRVADKMCDAIRDNGLGTVSVDGDGFKRTCKALGIKHTRKAIAAYLEAN